MQSLSTQFEHSAHQVDSTVKEAGFLISLPEVCLKLRQIMAKPSHSRTEIVDIIIRDPALATRILRIVNSAFYGLGKPVRDISQALFILGDDELNNLVIVTSIVKRLTALKPGIDINKFWRASIFSAVLAKNLAKHCKIQKEKIEEFFLSGLLLDVGKLLLCHHEPTLAKAIEKRTKNGDEADFEVERDLIGFDHADLGAAIAHSWNFSEELIDRISNHHSTPSSTTSVELTIAFLAGYISNVMDFATPKQLSLSDLKLINDDIMNLLELSNEQFFTIMNNSNDEYLHTFEAFCGGAL